MSRCLAKQRHATSRVVTLGHVGPLPLCEAHVLPQPTLLPRHPMLRPATPDTLSVTAHKRFVCGEKGVAQTTTETHRPTRPEICIQQKGNERDRSRGRWKGRERGEGKGGRGMA